MFLQGHESKEMISDFLTLLTVCHTVIPEVKKTSFILKRFKQTIILPALK